MAHISNLDISCFKNYDTYEKIREEQLKSDYKEFVIDLYYLIMKDLQASNIRGYETNTLFYKCSFNNLHMFKYLKKLGFKLIVPSKIILWWFEYIEEQKYINVKVKITKRGFNNLINEYNKILRGENNE
jgi:hypothetical protein